MSPDLKQNAINTIYLLFAHNNVVFAYFVGLLISLFIALKKPSRFAILLVIGFALLTFSFEYDKHIIEGFRNQTMTSLITATPHNKVSKVIDLIIADILPIMFYTAGWSCIFIAIIKKGLNHGTNN